MKIDSAEVKITRINISSSELAEDEGWVASFRANLIVTLGKAKDVKDSDLVAVVDSMYKAGKSFDQQKTGNNDEGPNTLEFKAKRKWGHIHHKFHDNDGMVTGIGEVKNQVAYRVVDGWLGVVYNVDMRLPMAELVRLIAFMDAPVKLSTSSAQTALFDKVEVA